MGLAIPPLTSKREPDPKITLIAVSNGYLVVDRRGTTIICPAWTDVIREIERHFGEGEQDD